MIKRQTHTTAFVLDQAEAIKFYKEMLGFEIRANFPVNDEFSWVTVSPKGQSDLELILAPIKKGPMFDEDSLKILKGLVQKGTFGIGVFETDDCQREYEHLSSKGVKFLKPPQEQSYGIEAVVQDNSGNWFSLIQRKKGIK